MNEQTAGSLANHGARATRPALRLGIVLTALIALAGAAALPAQGRRAAILADLGGGELPASAIAGAGDTLYAAHGAEIWRYRLDAPRWPGRLGDRPVATVTANIVRMDVNGDRLFVLQAQGLLAGLDITDRAAPTLRWRMQAPGGCVCDFRVYGQRLVILDRAGQLWAYTIQPDQPPLEVGRMTPSRRLEVADLRGNRLAALAHAPRPEIYGLDSVWLVTIDLTDPAHPRELGSVNLVGAYGYGRAGSRSVRIVDDNTVLAFPLIQPDFMGPFGFPWWSGLVIAVDVSNPATPRVVKSLDEDDAGRLPSVGWDDVGRIAALNGKLVLSGDRGLQLLDIANPREPLLSARQDLFESQLRDLTYAGGRIYALDEDGLLYAVTLSDPDVLALDHQTFTSRRAVGVAARGAWAFVAYDRLGVEVLDLSDPAQPQAAAWLDLDGLPLGKLALAGDRAFIAAGATGLVVVDIADPRRPRRLSVVDTPGTATEVTSAGDFAYVADGPAGVAVVSLADPTVPRLTAQVALSGTTTSVAVMGETLFAGSGYLDAVEGGLWAIPLANPASPALPDRPNISWSGPHLAVDGRHVFGLAGSDLSVWDPADLSQPIGNQSLNGAECCFRFPTDLQLHNGFAFGTSSEEGLMAVDVRQPARPAVAGRLRTPGRARQSALVAGQLFIADDHRGLHRARVALADEIHAVFLPSVSNSAVNFWLRQAFDPVDELGLNAGQPAVSPDGRRLVSVRKHYADTVAFYLTDVASRLTRVVPLPEGYLITSPEVVTFTPDGRGLVFAAVNDGWNIYRLDLADGRLIDLTRTPLGQTSQERRPSLSPDGRLLAFDRLDPSFAGLETAEDIFILNLETGAETRVTSHPAVDRFPSFSPDGQRLVFRSMRDGQSEIYEVGIDGSGLRRLTDDPAHDGYPSYRPDGRWISFQSNRNGHDDVYVLRLADRSVRRVNRGDLVLREPRFAPDGQSMVVASPLPTLWPETSTASLIYWLTLLPLPE